MDWLPLAGLIVAMTALLYKVLRDQLTDLRADQNRRLDELKEEMAGMRADLTAVHRQLGQIEGRLPFHAPEVDEELLQPDIDRLR